MDTLTDDAAAIGDTLAKVAKVAQTYRDVDAAAAGSLGGDPGVGRSVAELGETQDPQDLVPGRPDAIEENAQVLLARAERAGHAAEGLRAIDTGSWEGPAARA